MRRDPNLRESYVYILFRPDGRPCYVGKGIRDRWMRHEHKPQNPHLANIIAQAGGTIPKVKIREHLTDAEACEIEMAFIAAIGRKAKGGPLVNMTDGGDGVRGHTHTKSAEVRARLSAAHKGKKQSAERRAAASLRMMGNPSPRKGVKLPPEQVAKMSEISKANGSRPPSRAGTVNTPESNQKRSAALKAYWAKRALEKQSHAIQESSPT